MSTQPEIIQLRDELKKLQDQSKKGRFRGIIGTVLMVLVMVTCMVYALVKNVESVKNFEEANRQRMLAEESRLVAEQSASEAQKQREISEKIIEELYKCQSARKR